MIEQLRLINDETELTFFLTENYEQLYDYLASQQHSVLHKRIREFQLIIARQNNLYKKLENDNSLALGFVELLLEVCERYALVAQFRLLYEILKSKNYQVSSHTEVAALFYINISTIEDYSNRLDEILTKLIYVDEFEEDNSDKSTIILINYYSQVVKYFWEFNSEGVNSIKGIIENSISEAQNYSFLKSHLLKEVLGYSIENYDVFQEKVQTLLDKYFDLKVLHTYTDNDDLVFLIETGTDYANAISNINANFEEIRRLSFRFNYDNSNDIFYSLKRGVSVLETEQQLYRYMVAYSAMHQAKLQEALQKIDAIELTKITHVVDWGCGQAIGSVVFCDYLKSNGLKFNDKKFTLIEPSKIAISRGSLHIRTFNSICDISTVNKEFDQLNQQYFDKNNLKETTLHIFSNILDVELFSLTKLTSLITNIISGRNIFICVSPYINELKTNRVNAFVNHFQNELNFKLIASKDCKKTEWKDDWTMVLRVFSVEL